MIRPTSKPHGATLARSSSTRPSTPVAEFTLFAMLVPPAHGEWLAANVAGCVVKVDDDAGHLGSDPEQEIAEHML